MLSCCRVQDINSIDNKDCSDILPVDSIDKYELYPQLK